jgi:hypothetical protein
MGAVNAGRWSRMIAGTIALVSIGLSNLGARDPSLKQEPISASQPIDLSAFDGSLMRAKELYWTAAFDEALSVLEPLKIDGSSLRGIEVGMYRTLCLVALRRLDEADEAVQSIVRENPLYRPSDAEITPRARTLFHEVRRRLLPSIARQTYERANEALDRGGDARGLFDRVFAMLDDPDVADLAELSDLRTSTARARDRIQADATRQHPRDASTASQLSVPNRQSAPHAELDAINRVVEQYVNAFNSLDGRAVLTIWPSLDERALTKAFSQLAEQELRLDACQVDMTGPRASVSCHGRLRYLPKVGGQASRTREGRWTFQLRNTKTWTIESVAIR